MNAGQTGTGSLLVFAHKMIWMFPLEYLPQPSILEDLLCSAQESGLKEIEEGLGVVIRFEAFFLDLWSH